MVLSYDLSVIFIGGLHQKGGMAVGLRVFSLLIPNY